MALLWFLAAVSSPVLADGVPYILEWDANIEPDTAGYIVRYGTAPGVYTSVVIHPGTTTSLVIPNLDSSTFTYYFVVSAYNTADLEGPQSFETNTNPGDTVVTSIALNYGKVIPDVANGTDFYVAFVPFNTGSIVVTPKAQDGAATVTVNGTNVPAGSASGSIAINENTTTTITIVVTAKDGTTSRTITLSITRLTAIESWRLFYFGSAANTGLGADLASPQNDGIPNLLKFATRTNPTHPEEPYHTQGTPEQGNNSILFTYRRNVAALEDEMIFTVEWSDTLQSGSWSSAGVTEWVVPNGDSQNVTVTVPAGPGRYRFVRLVVTYP